MRGRISTDDVKRWDQRGDDPRQVCFTCRYFENDTVHCRNPKKKCTSSFHSLSNSHNDDDCNKIFYYKIYACDLHEFHPDFLMFMKGTYAKQTLDAIVKQRRDIEMELSCLKDIEAIKRKYDVFLIEKPNINIKNTRREIDLDIHYKNGFSFNALYIDDVDISATKVFTNTVQIFGFKKTYIDNFNPVHHSVYASGIKSAKFSIKFNRPGLFATVHRDGCEFSVSGIDMVALLRDLPRLDLAFELLTKYAVIEQKLRYDLPSIIARVLGYLRPRLKLPYPNYKFNNVNDFGVIFPIFADNRDNDRYGEIRLKYDNKGINILLNIKHIIQLEYVAIIKELKELIVKNNLECTVLEE